MHNLMLSNLVHAPVSFFDVTPIGRIVNRFSGDIANLDISTPVQYHQLIVVTLQLLNSLLVVGVMLPVFFIWLVPMAYLNNSLTARYRVCGRELKRLASNSRSPMFQHFNETINVPTPGNSCVNQILHLAPVFGSNDDTRSFDGAGFADSPGVPSGPRVCCKERTDSQRLLARRDGAELLATVVTRPSLLLSFPLQWTKCATYSWCCGKAQPRFA